MEFLAANELEQIIKEPTRVTCNTRSLIDLLVTSTPSLFRSSGVLSTTISDHYPIFGVTNGPAICPHKHRILTTRTWNDESRKNFINDLKKTPWTFLEFFDDVEDMYSAWECLFKSLIDSHLPIKRKRLRKQTHPWLDNSVLRMMRTRNKANKKAIRTGLTEDWQKYRRLRNQVTSSSRKNRKAYFTNKLRENRANPKAYWNTLHQVLPSKDRSTKIEKLSIDGNQVTNKPAIANSLNQYFTKIASTFLADQPPPEPQPIKLSPSKLFKFKPLLDSDVYMALKTINPSKTTGADNISAKYLKIAVPHISGTLTKIFNQSYNCGRYPSAWKIAKVSSVFKGGGGGGQRQNAIITDQYLCFRVFLRYMNLLQTRLLLIMHKKLV